MAEQNGTPQSPDSVITTQRDGQTIVAELFFNSQTDKSRKKRKSRDRNRPDEEWFAGAVSI